MIMVSNSLLNFLSLCVIVSFITKLLTMRTLFSTAVRAVVAANLVILGIWPLISFMLALRVVSVPKLVESGILSSIYFILALHISFLTVLCFTASLTLFKSSGTGTYLSKSNLSTLIFKLSKFVAFLNLFLLHN